jgi:hypothetical protein
MATLTLQNCIPILVFAPTNPPIDVDIAFSIGGLPAGGQVDVTAGPGEMNAPLSLPTSSSGSINIPQVTQISVHYRKRPGGPDTVDVEIDVTPAP